MLRKRGSRYRQHVGKKPANKKSAATKGGHSSDRVTGRASCGETGSAMEGVSAPSATGSARGITAPNPAATQPTNSVLTTRVANGLRSVRGLALRAEPQTFGSGSAFELFQEMLPE